MDGLQLSTAPKANLPPESEQILAIKHHITVKFTISVPGRGGRVASPDRHPGPLPWPNAPAHRPREQINSIDALEVGFEVLPAIAHKQR